MQLNNKVARRRSLEIGIENMFVYIEERVVDDARNRFVVVICCSSQRNKIKYFHVSHALLWA